MNRFFGKRYVVFIKDSEEIFKNLENGGKPMPSGNLKDFEIYLRLAKQARHKPERDFYITSAKLALRRAGYDISDIPEDPNQALYVLENIHMETPTFGSEAPERSALPYSELFAQIDSL